MRPCRECGEGIDNRETYCANCQQKLETWSTSNSENESSPNGIGRDINISGEPLAREEDRSYELFSMLFATIMCCLGGMVGLLVASLTGGLIGAAAGFGSTWVILWLLRQF